MAKEPSALVIIDLSVSLRDWSLSEDKRFIRDGSNKNVTNNETIKAQRHHPAKIDNWFYTKD